MGYNIYKGCCGGGGSGSSGPSLLEIDELVTAKLADIETKRFGHLIMNDGGVPSPHIQLPDDCDTILDVSWNGQDVSPLENSGSSEFIINNGVFTINTTIYPIETGEEVEILYK